jgi:hypothetical protein
VKYVQTYKYTGNTTSAVGATEKMEAAKSLLSRLIGDDCPYLPPCLFLFFYVGAVPPRCFFNRSRNRDTPKSLLEIVHDYFTIVFVNFLCGLMDDDDGSVMDS